MRTLILDSSVIIKWFKFKDESKVKEAKYFLTEFRNKKLRIIISQLTYFELLNISAFDSNIPVNEWQNIIQVLFDIDFTLLSLTYNLAQDTYSIAKKFKISAYDASYIALAKTHKVDFITADQKLVTKVDLPFVKLL
ncbi:hypothetical protein A2767_02020 [Candidatus Roizmanbacteria bacterium RIFCSPHIGHO2_01_FULL_35_10]|uniref:PIN domain-containing protein n=1 Tax=Candidatus Roizmanbacteria bacterium RIFCSPLOWO2_01_FULL_35_13 TaxID=1802055 RepID=A0A1F7I788_9BACT|nr:MAG: hypothetical protein A2767_02020 [Candidatus Roizmanbacteria bacterium RIFCSPHIGHO2_01_FULL_35_10]OGK39237.1 MAG: hypothetical protein A3A74_07435 [Candidatus Roizmanbacteria bacterium RIFCSPLOWO2_01_FULL_35_13]